jgi:DNA-binding NtrC family response regulator
MADTAAGRAARTLIYEKSVRMKTLLSIVEAGGYPDLCSEYEQLGCKVNQVNSLRKAISYLKKNTPDIVVAEYNHQTMFRDRTSSLESLMAALQNHPEIRIIVLLEKKDIEYFARVESRFAIFDTIFFPIDFAELKNKINAAMLVEN